MISDGLNLAIVGIAVGNNPTPYGLFVGGTLGAGVNISSEALCNNGADAAEEAFEDAMFELQMEIQWMIMQGSPFCVVNECPRVPVPNYPGEDPEFDLFVQQTWDIITLTINELSDTSSGTAVINASPIEIG